MCGIVGIISSQPVAPRLLDALRRLEYRGYDSAGLATLVNGHIERRRAEGKLDRLAARLDEQPLAGTIGIGHTRWATHGQPNETNAHPHATARVAVVHNGIIENFQELRAELQALGHVFESETDSEIIAHLVTHYLDRQEPPRYAAQRALGRLEGAFALALLFAGEHELMIGARRGSPLAVGFGDGEMFLGSDALALAPWTDRICYLEEGDWVEIRPSTAVVRRPDGEMVQRPTKRTQLSGAAVGKGGYRHFMQKEIWEQPSVIGDTIAALTDARHRAIALPEMPVDLARLPRLAITACGTAFLAGAVAKYWFEKLARLPVDLDVASEFRYRDPPLAPGGAVLAVSQSGETADTLAALRAARAAGQAVLSVVNQPESTIARESDGVLPTLAGPEIGVASTKAFTTQLTVLLCLAIAAARARGAVDAAGEARLVDALAGVPALATEVLGQEAAVARIAERVALARDVLYLGRGASFPIAMEGALKLKEISYIHAEGYAAGEMKHGPIALIDSSVPVIVIAPGDALFDKTASNVEEVMARGGQVILLTDAAGARRLGPRAFATLVMPDCDAVVAPILYALPVQLLAYHVAVLKGTDVDQPRNLAKSVTVE